MRAELIGFYTSLNDVQFSCLTALCGFCLLGYAYCKVVLSGD